MKTIGNKVRWAWWTALSFFGLVPPLSGKTEYDKYLEGQQDYGAELDPDHFYKLAHGKHALREDH